MYDAGPQGLNRYSYALNNPILYRDPTGHFVNGPNDSQDPDDYGCITGSQEQFADGTATVHVGSTYEDVWGRGMTLDEYDSGGDVFFPLDPRIYTSPYPNYPSPDPMGYVKGKLQDLERQLYDEGGSVQQRIVDTQQGMMDELVSQGTSVLDIADPTGGLISGWQSRLVSGASERVMNFSYDTASGGLRPRENSLWYKTGKYGTAVIIFLATIEASGGSSKTSKTKTAAEIRAENIAKGIPESQLGPSGKPKFHYSNSATRKKMIDAAKSQGSGKIVVDKATSTQPKHIHALDLKGKRIKLPRKTHFNVRGSKPRS